MFMRRSLFEDLKGFDERFFMYGEDLDLCWRIREKGYRVWYHPAIQIIHLKGKSSAKRMLASRIAFYEAMILFSRKYQHTHRSFFPRWLIHVAIIGQAALNIGSNIVKAGTTCLIDLAVINVTLATCLTLRFAYTMKSPYAGGHVSLMLGVHALLSISFLFMFAYNGVYSRKKTTTTMEVLFSGFLASVIFMACMYYLKALAFSRIAFGLAAAIAMLLLAAWRKTLPLMMHQLKRVVYARGTVVIIGSGPVPGAVIQNIERQKTATIAGILWTGEAEQPGQFEGYPVLGNIDDVAAVLKRMRVDMLLVATPLSWYSPIIEALAKVKVKNLTIRWVPRELFDRKIEELPAVIPLHDFSV